MSPKSANEFSGILRFWTAIAVVVVFYGAAVAAVVACGVIAYFGWWKLPGSWEGLITGALGAGAYIVVQVFAPRRVLRNIGVELTRDSQPELFDRIAAAAQAADARMPDGVLLSFDGTRLILTGLRRRRTLLVGFFHLLALTRSQLDALLIRELLEPYPGLQLSVSRLAAAHRRAASSFFPERQGPLQSWTGKCLRAVKRVLEPAKSAAERSAAELIGGDVYIAAVSQRARVDCIANSLLVDDIGPAAISGFMLPMSEGFQAMLSDPVMIAFMDESLRRAGDIQRRLSALRSIPLARDRNDRPACALVRDSPGLEQELARNYLRRIGRTPGRLKSLEWKNRGVSVAMPLREQFVAKHAKDLENLKLLDAFAIASKPYSWAVEILTDKSSLLPSPPVPIKDGEHYAKSLLAASIQCRLHATGWTSEWEAGADIMRRGDKAFNPYQTIEAIHQGEISLDQWNRQIEDLGIFPNMPLAQLSGSRKSAVKDED